jgi:hypothetical protein
LAVIFACAMCALKKRRQAAVLQSVVARKRNLPFLRSGDSPHRIKHDPQVGALLGAIPREVRLQHAIQASWKK